MGRTACTEPQCLYSIATPLLPLWAVRPVQSLSACTVELYLYSPYGPYSLYRASVPVQRCTLPFLILLFIVCGEYPWSILEISNFQNRKWESIHIYNDLNRLEELIWLGILPRPISAVRTTLKQRHGSNLIQFRQIGSF